MTRLPSVSELLVATNQTNRNENNRCSRSDQPLRTEYVQPTQQQAYCFTSPQAQPMYYSTCFAEHVPHYVCPLPHLHSTAQPMPPSFSHNMQNNYFGAPTWNAAESKAFSERSLRSDEVRFTPPNFLDTNNSNPPLMSTIIYNTNMLWTTLMTCVIFRWFHRSHLQHNAKSRHNKIGVPRCIKCKCLLILSSYHTSWLMRIWLLTTNVTS